MSTNIKKKRVNRKLTLDVRVIGRMCVRHVLPLFAAARIEVLRVGASIRAIVVHVHAVAAIPDRRIADAGIVAPVVLD